MLLTCWAICNYPSPFFASNILSLPVEPFDLEKMLPGLWMEITVH